MIEYNNAYRIKITIIVINLIKKLHIKLISKLNKSKFKTTRMFWQI